MGSLAFLNAVLLGVFALQPHRGDAAMPSHEAFRVSVAAIGWPGARRGFLVQADDVFNGEWHVRIERHPSARSAKAQSPPIESDPEGTPMALWSERANGIEWQSSVTAVPPRDSAMAYLVASIEVTARNTGSRPESVSVVFALSHPSAERAFTALDRGVAAAPGDELVDAFATGPQSGSASRQGAVLAPGASASFRILMPTVSAPRRQLQRDAQTQHSEYMRQVRGFWRSVLNSGLRIQLDDERTERACREALAVLLCAWEARGQDVLPIGSPFQYRDIWVRDGARAIAALALWGHMALARSLAGGLMAFQWPQGFIMSQRGQPDGTGQALWALEQAYLRGNERTPPPHLVASGVRAWRWLEGQRTNIGTSMPGVQPYATPNDNEGVRAQLTGTDFWAIAGYRAVERLSRSVAQADLADSVAETLEDYRGVVERSLRTFDDIPPSWQGCGWDWGNLSAVFPCGAVRVDDPRMMRLAARVWAQVGGAGLCAYGNPDSLHYYMGADLGTWALLNGRRASADSVLEAMLCWRTASGGAPELFSRSNRDFGKNLPPHCTSAAALLTLVRNTLVCDVDDTLRLTLGARHRWWRNGGSIAQAATRWGNVDMTFRLTNDRAEWRWTPVPVWTTLTLPEGTRGRDGPTRGMRNVACPPGTAKAGVRIRKSR